MHAFQYRNRKTQPDYCEGKNKY